MTTIMKMLEDTKVWAEKELCSTFKFKVQPINRAEDDNYDYCREYPKAYVLYPNVNNRYPSVTIQLSNSEILNGRETARINLLFAIWNNGHHYNDDGDVPVFEPNQEGYKDVWNWVDLSLQKLLKTEYVGNYIRIKHEESIAVNSAKEDGTIPNYYPIFGASISFSVEFATQQVQDEFI